MPKTIMSVTRALVEIKRLDEKFATAATSACFVSVATGKNANRKVKNSTVEQVENLIKSDVQSLQQFASNRQKIKSAVVLSNANTKLEFQGRQVTVAEAIELKSTVQSKRSVLNAMVQQYNNAAQIINVENEKLEVSINAALQAVYGNEKNKVDPAMYESVANPQREQKEASIIDPCGIQDMVKKLKEEISGIESELDFLLSESNAKTTIEVDLTTS